MSLIINALRHPVLISYLSGANNYSFVHFRNGEQLMISKSLSYLEKQLSYFIRIHKTALINPDCVKELLPPPHTKTSGGVILEGGTILPVSRRQWPLLLKEVQLEKGVERPERSIALISGDSTKSLLLGQLIADQWPQTLLHVVENGSALPQLLLSLTEADRPALILLDLRQATPSRLGVLRELKENPQLRWLPVVVLVASNLNTNAIGPGYALQANSAVVVPDDNTQFLVIMEHICRYWLTMAALPTV